MKKKLTCIAALMLASFAASADDETPNAENVEKLEWLVYIPSSQSAPNMFVLFYKQPCTHQYTGKLKGTETSNLRTVTIYKDKGGEPGEAIGKGCWSADKKNQKLDYLGYDGLFNAEKDGQIMSIPWSEASNLSAAG